MRKENKPVVILMSMLLTKVCCRHKMNVSMDVQSPAVIFPRASSSLIFSKFSTLWNNHGRRIGKVHCFNSLLDYERRHTPFAAFSNSVLLLNASLFQMTQELAFTISCRWSSTANKCHRNFFFPLVDHLCLSFFILISLVKL